MGNGLSLATFLSVNARIGAVRVDKSKDRPAIFFCDLHHAQRFAVAFRVGRAKVAVNALLHVPTLLRADNQNFLAVKASHAADDGGIVPESAVAVNFAEIGKQAFNIVEGLGTLWVAGQFGFLPGSLGRLHLPPQISDAFLEFEQLTAGIVTLAIGFNGCHLPLDLFHLLPRFIIRLH